MSMRSIFLDLISSQEINILRTWLIKSIDGFSERMKLFWFQREAVLNSLFILHLFFSRANGNKETFRNFLASLFPEIENLYPDYAWNRMAFWMATGSGKTVVMLKLVEIIQFLIKNRLIPNKPILILSHKKTLINQILAHWNESSYFSQMDISVDLLKDATDISNPTRMDQIYIYRSDLIGERQTKMIIDYRTIENQGNWYIFLDEAHKGDSNDSSRKQIFTELSRNGFLFNFSATFTDEIDYLTTVYNFNLKEYIAEGYGKQIFLMRRNLAAFQRKDRNVETNLETFVEALVLICIIKTEKKFLEKQNLTYHEPLFTIFTNTTTVRKSDLEHLTELIHRFMNKSIGMKMVAKSKNRLLNEFNFPKKPVLGNREVKLKQKQIENITYLQILNDIFHAEEPGYLEFIFPNKSRTEILLRIRNSAQPFGLIKIGNVTRWKNQIIPKDRQFQGMFTSDHFSKLNEDGNPITILLGSRVFYEGWDSLRPNVVFFVNLGRGRAKKFLLQSLGRGVRINPFGSKRKRVEFIKNYEDSKKANSSNSYLIESLFVFPSDTRILKEVLDELDILALPKKPVKHVTYKIEGDLQAAKEYVEWINDPKIIYAMFAEIPNLTYKLVLEFIDFLKKNEFERKQFTIDFHSNLELTIRNFLGNRNPIKNAY